jgi:predicted Rossmann fold flavoprotein
MCAIEAGRRGRSVCVLEANDRPGKKILISGGGRCNFTNLYAGPDNYFSANPDFCRSALARYTPGQFIELVEAHNIPYHEKKLGQLFCDGSARAILDMLLAECAAAGVELHNNTEVWQVDKRDTGFELDTSAGELACEALVVATGGLSIPKLGASDFGYRIATQFGLGMVEPRPGLVPLTFSSEDQHFFESLSGVSVDAAVSCRDASFRENILFTHRGLSGPAILQASSRWYLGDIIAIDLLPGTSAHDLLLEARDDVRELATLLSAHLPQRFARAWCTAYAPSMPMQRYSERQLASIAERLHRWELTPAGSEGYAKAEVTVGGIDTRELSQRTMEASKAPGLFFVGEVVDVTGWLGGYNFQWAWASGWAAGQAV